MWSLCQALCHIYRVTQLQMLQLWLCLKKINLLSFYCLCKNAWLNDTGISLPSDDLSSGSESLNASNTRYSHLPTKVSELPNLRTFITSYLFILLAVLALHPSLRLLGHLHHPLKNNRSLISLCFTLSLESTPFISSSTSFWNQFFHFWLTYSFTHHFFLFWFTTLLIHNSLFHSQLKTYLFHKSNPP